MCQARVATGPLDPLGSRAVRLLNKFPVVIAVPALASFNCGLQEPLPILGAVMPN